LQVQVRSACRHLAELGSVTEQVFEFVVEDQG